MHLARRLTHALCALGLLLPFGAALGQSFGFSPTVINLNTDQTLTTQTTLLNAGQTPARFKVEVVRWEMKDGQSVLTPTRDVIVNPPEFTLKPGARQVIRLGLRQKPGSQELTYRLVVRQVELPGSMPQQTVAVAGAPAGASAQLNVALAFSLPLYAAPGAARAQVAYTLRDGAAPALTLTNSGSRHETYTDLVASRGAKRLDVSAFALLAGASRTLDLTELAGEGGPLTLTFLNAAGQPTRVVVQAP